MKLKIVIMCTSFSLPLALLSLSLRPLFVCVRTVFWVVDQTTTNHAPPRCPIDTLHGINEQIVQSCNGHRVLLWVPTQMQRFLIEIDLIHIDRWHIAC